MNTRKIVYKLMTLLLLGAAQTFQPNANAVGPFVYSTGLALAFDGGAAWGDYDNDNRLDLLVTAQVQTGAGVVLLQVWHNNGDGTFSTNDVGTEMVSGPAQWADFNNDGYLDIIVTGRTNYQGASSVTGIWRNEAGTNFVRVPNVLTSNRRGTMTIADFDNDGKVDVAILSETGSTNAIYRNLGAFGFTTAGMPAFPNVPNGQLAFGDVDNDGWADLLVAGALQGTIYRNVNGVSLTNAWELFSATHDTRGAFADYNNDGRLDLAASIPAGNGSITNAHVFFNYGEGFTESGANFEEVAVFATTSASSAISWADFDNDGLPDVYLYWNRENKPPRVYHNNGDNTFAAIAGDFSDYIGLPSGRLFGIWGDCNNDGKLDLFISETDPNDASYRFSLYTNNIAVGNTPPTAPNGLKFELAEDGTDVTLSWQAASDAETPAAGLSYNIRVGTTPGGCDVVSPMADAVTGWRRVPALGNAYLRHFSLVRNLEIGRTYYWSVQAIDSGYAGGAWAPEASFTTRVPLAGDTNNDGVVSVEEFNGVLANYLAASPYLKMTNSTGLGGNTVTFALTNDIAGSFNVEYSTNLSDWTFLGTAEPRYLFTDPDAGSGAQRFYRLRLP